MDSKRVILRLNGSLESGFQAILEVRQGLDRILTEASGVLPACPELIPQIYNWQESYRKCLQQGRISGLQIETIASLPERITRCNRLGQSLSALFCDWLGSPSLNELGFGLREVLNPDDDVQVLVRSTDIRLHRLPWHNWPLLKSYPRLEVSFGSPPKSIDRPASSSEKVRVLAILGDRTNIDTDVDRALLSALPQAEVQFLVEPSRAELTRLLWQQPWDILFFAGHSYSLGKQGQISINPTESLTIEQLSNGLQQAISRGLQLAIFNSCDGLGIAYELEELHLPQLIVMREPVPDDIAQIFLKAFLADFSQGAPLAEALRKAREQLQGLESQYPAATWLPVLFQNSAMLAPTWQSLQKHPEPVRPLWKRLVPPLGIGTAAAAIVMGVRLLGLLQPAELALFDSWVRSRPAELPDERIVIIEATKADLEQELPGELKQGQSLSDKTQAMLLERLLAYEPDYIGWDIYRDFATDQPQLGQRLAETENLLTICKFRNYDPANPLTSVDGYAPAPEIPEANSAARIGFSDALDYPDGTFRIQLLYSDPNEICPATYSFSALLGFSYLVSKYNTAIASTSEEDVVWRWGDVAIAPIGAAGPGKGNKNKPYGPYARADSSGHQIWLNYRSSEPLGGGQASPIHAFKRFTVAEVREGKLNKWDIQDKVILVGISGADRVLNDKDAGSTPFRDSAGEPLVIPGVYIQAQMTSQLISAALDGRKLLRSFPWALDLLVVWAVSLALLSLTARWSFKQLVIATAIEILLLYAICFGVFVYLGFYLPWMPASLALVLGGAAAKQLGIVKRSSLEPAKPI